MRRRSVSEAIVLLVVVGSIAGWTEAAPQVDMWYHPNDAPYSVDLVHRICERDCISEPSYLCDFYECDESEGRVCGELNSEDCDVSYEEDEDHEEDACCASESYEVFDCGSDEEVTTTEAPCTSTVRTIAMTSTTATSTETENTTEYTTQNIKPSKKKKKRYYKSTTERVVETTECSETTTTEAPSTPTSTTQTTPATTMTTSSTTPFTTSPTLSTEPSTTSSTTTESSTTSSTTPASTTSSTTPCPTPPSLVPLKNCQCYLFCDKQNCRCHGNEVNPTKPPANNNELEKSGNRGGVRRWTDKNDVYARIYRKMQKLTDGPVGGGSRVRRVTMAPTTSTTSTTPVPTATTKLSTDSRRRRVPPARQLNRLLHKGAKPEEVYRLLENYYLTERTASKRELDHRKSEYREGVECALRPWSPLHPVGVTPAPGTIPSLFRHLVLLHRCEKWENTKNGPTQGRLFRSTLDDRPTSSRANRAEEMG
uniref:Uncharacterized protein n=1 Tax=Anopheles farauti TaxID=69004 RepID=A0A182QF55_9DIPT